jgi:hypothetical protein
VGISIIHEPMRWVLLMMGTGVQAGSGRLLEVSVGGTDVALLILQQTPGRGIMSEEKILWGGCRRRQGCGIQQPAATASPLSRRVQWRRRQEQSSWTEDNEEQRRAEQFVTGERKGSQSGRLGQRCGMGHKIVGGELTK